MPSAPIQPMAGLPTLTSSELYTQTLAAQADVLVAAKAWPLLTKSLADLTDIPGRQQLAIDPIILIRVTRTRAGIICAVYRAAKRTGLAGRGAR